MTQFLGALTLLVRDYDEAIAYYIDILGFDLLEDTKLSGSKRWVLVRPRGAWETALLLAQAVKPEEIASIGCQSGGRVFLFLRTDNFERDYKMYQERGVEFIEEPREEVYGTVVVFKDLYGNLWDLIETA